MASSDLNLNVINFQDPLRSRPIRNNFQDIQAEYNALRAEVNASIASTASEITSARDNYTNLQDNIHARKPLGNYIKTFEDYRVTQHPSGATLGIGIATGSGFLNGVGVENTGSLIATMGLPASGMKRIDTVVVDTTNAVSILSSSEVNATASTLPYPSIAGTEMILAHYTIFDTTSTIGNSRIVDDRQPLMNPFVQEEHSNASFSYNGETLSTVTITNRNNEDRFFDMNYTGETLASLGINLSGYRFSLNLNYTGETFASVSHFVEKL